MEKKTKKLQLNKETVAVLNGEKMSRVRGGDAARCEQDNDCPAGMMCMDGICVEAGGTIGQGTCYACTDNTCVSCNGGVCLTNTCVSCEGTCRSCISGCVTKCLPGCNI